MTGAQAAERILQSQGIYDVAIQRVSGKLTDHYDPRNKTLNLSDAVYASTSVAAVGVAAHECGHAVQHQAGYVPIKIRNGISADSKCLQHAFNADFHNRTLYSDLADWQWSVRYFSVRCLYFSL